jgi:hypothetical protein
MRSCSSRPAVLSAPAAARWTRLTECTMPLMRCSGGSSRTGARTSTAPSISPRVISVMARSARLPAASPNAQSLFSGSEYASTAWRAESLPGSVSSGSQTSASAAKYRWRVRLKMATPLASSRSSGCTVSHTRSPLVGTDVANLWPGAGPNRRPSESRSTTRALCGHCPSLPATCVDCGREGSTLLDVSCRSAPKTRGKAGRRSCSSSSLPPPPRRLGRR